MVTMRKVKFANIVDLKLLPLEDLRPYLKPSALEAAVKDWARATEYKGTMAGVEVGERDDTVIR